MVAVGTRTRNRRAEFAPIVASTLATLVPPDASVAMGTDLGPVGTLMLVDAQDLRWLLTSGTAHAGLLYCICALGLAHLRFALGSTGDALTPGAVVLLPPLAVVHVLPR